MAMRGVLRLLILLAAATLAAAAGRPVPDVMKVKLTYFDIRGLAEPIRLYLSSIGVPFEEETVGKCPGDQAVCDSGILDWDTFKKAGIQSGLLPFGQVPLMTLGNKVDADVPDLVLAQSHAILRFFAKYSFGTDTKLTNPQQTFFDMVAGGVQDMRSRYSKLVYGGEVSTDALRTYAGKGAAGEANPKSLRAWLHHFEHLLAHGEEFFHIAEDVMNGVDPASFAPALVWDMLDTNLRVDATCLRGLPRLQALHTNFAKVPGVAAYLSSARRRGRANGDSAFFDTPSTPPLYDVTYAADGTVSVVPIERAASINQGTTQQREL